MLMHRQGGFSLAEMAIVLVIVGILMASGLGALSSQLSNQRFKETKLLVERANEALLGYALSHNHLPCPADAGGDESARTAGICTVLYGDLPWLALGLPERDSYGNRLKYRVTAPFTEIGTLASGEACGDAGNSKPCFFRTSSADNMVKSTAGINLLSTGVPAIVFSEGQNGNNSGGDANEAENRSLDNNDKDFVQGVPDAGFDDILLWLPTTTLIYRFSALGVWNN